MVFEEDPDALSREARRDRQTDLHWSAVQVRLEDLRGEVQQLRTDTKEDIAQMGKTLGTQIHDIVKGVVETSGAKWEAHVGEGGVHDRLDNQRKEDISRSQNSVIVVVTIISAVLGSGVLYLFLR